MAIPLQASNFPTTTWTLVVSAGRKTEADRTAAMATLCERYWYPIYTFVRRRGYPVEHAQDLTQEFFVRLLERRHLEIADRNKGRFRSFLLASVKNFLFDEADRQNALKRGGGRSQLSLDLQAGEERYQLEPSHTETPERIFEREWALALIDRVLFRLREEFVRAGKEIDFERLRAYLSGRSEAPYARLAAELGSTEGALRVAVHRFRRRYRDLLKAEIAETVATPEEVEEEIRHLMGAVRATERRSL